MPKTKKTFITTYRGDLTDIATIARWMTNQGFTPRSRNELINCAVTNFTKQLVKMFPEDAIVETGDALEFLTDLGLIGKNLTQMQPAISREFWDSSTPAPGVPISNSSELTTKAKKQDNDNLAGLALDLMNKANQRNLADTENAKKLANTAHLPIAEETEENN